MREFQAKRQRIHGSIDAGTRGQVTDGKQLDGFANLVKEIGLLAEIDEDYDDFCFVHVQYAGRHISFLL